MFSEQICRNSTDRSASPAEKYAGCQLYTPGGVLKDMQVHRCVGFSQIPDFTENWNNPHSSLLCSETSETPCPWDKSHQTWHWAGSRPKTALWVHPISWSPEGDSNECFLEVALGKRSHWVFSNTPALKTKVVHRNVEDC